MRSKIFFWKPIKLEPFKKRTKTNSFLYFLSLFQQPNKAETPGNFIDEFYDYVFTIERDSAGGDTITDVDAGAVEGIAVIGVDKKSNLFLIS